MQHLTALLSNAREYLRSSVVESAFRRSILAERKFFLSVGNLSQNHHGESSTLIGSLLYSARRAAMHIRAERPHVRGRNIFRIERFSCAGTDSSTSSNGAEAHS